MVIPNGVYVDRFAGAPRRPRPGRARRSGRRWRSSGGSTSRARGCRCSRPRCRPCSRRVPVPAFLVLGRGDGDDALDGLWPTRAGPPSSCSVALDDDDKAALLRSVDVYVAPHTGGESFGIVLVEAMSAGAPVAGERPRGLPAGAGRRRARRCSSRSVTPPRWRRRLLRVLDDGPAVARDGRAGRRRPSAATTGPGSPSRCSPCTRPCGSAPTGSGRTRSAEPAGPVAGGAARRCLTCSPGSRTGCRCCSPCSSCSAGTCRTPRPGWTGCTTRSSRPGRRSTRSSSGAAPPPSRSRRSSTRRPG